jgi:hypothetical protein
VNNILDRKLQGKKQCGRLTNRWDNNIKTDQEIQCKGRDWIEVAPVGFSEDGNNLSGSLKSGN